MDKFFLKKALLSSISFCAYFLGIIFTILSAGAFLDTIGSKGIPVALSVAWFLLIVYFLINSFLAPRISPQKLFIGSVLLFAVLFSLNFFGVGNLRWFAILFYLLSNFLNYFLDFSVTNFANSIITPFQGKSVLPIVNAFQGIGKTAGSAAAGYLAIRHGDFLWPAMMISGLLLLTVLAAITGAMFKPKASNSMPPQKKESAGADLLREVGKSLHFVFRKSNLFFVIALFFVLRVFLLAFIDFKLLTNMKEAFSGTELTRTLGLVYGIQSSLYLFFNLFVVRRFLFRFGVANVFVVFPLFVSLAFAAMLMLGMGPLGVAVLFILTKAPNSSFVSVSLTQVLSQAPKKINQAVYLMIRGVLVSAANLLSSISLLIYTFNLKLEKVLNTSLIGLTIVLMFLLVLRLRKTYFNSLKENIQSEDEDLKLKSIDLLAERVYWGRGEWLLRKILDSKISSETMRSRAMISLGVIGNLDSIVDLMGVVKNGTLKERFLAIENIDKIVKSRDRLRSVPLTKHLLLKTYEDILVSEDPTFIKLKVISSLEYFDIDEIIEFLEDQLKSDDLSIKLNVIRTLGVFQDRGIIPYLKPLLEHPDKRVVRQVIRGLWKFEDLRLLLLPQMILIFSSSKVENIENSLILIHKLKMGWEKGLVEMRLKHADPYIRTLANLTMVSLGESKYLRGFVNGLLSLEQWPEKLDFLVSQYRKLGDKQKNKVLELILEMDSQSVERFQKIFSNSMYGFDNEVEALSVEHGKGTHKFPWIQAAKTLL